MPKKPNHEGFHLYRRVNISSDKNHKVFVMKCIKPECSHYIRMNTKLSCPLLWNQVGECNRCAEPFILNRRALRMGKPICNECIKRKVKAKPLIELEKLLFEGVE